jgi:UDP-glucose 4-epimerase
MNYLVTGAAGFIGSSLVDRLLAAGHRVVGVDNFSTGQRRFLTSALQQPAYRLVEADLLNPASLSGPLLGVDAVYHFAANADIRGGLASPRRDLEQNTLATFNLLEAMREAGVGRIVFASSAAALGEPTQFPTPESCAIPIQTSLYGASKMACEGLISAYCEGHGMEGYAFRFVSLLGPRYPHGHVFDFVRQLLADPTRLRVLGDGSPRKSYLHIDDCLDALLHICERQHTAQAARHRYEVYHLGCPDHCRVRDSVGWICDELGLSPTIQYGEGQRGWVGDNPFVFLDIGKALATGWTPRHGIEASVRETARWLVANRWLFEARPATQSAEASR